MRSIEMQYRTGNKGWMAVRRFQNLDDAKTALNETLDNGSDATRHRIVEVKTTVLIEPEPASD